MEHAIELNWNNKMWFTTEISGHKIEIDAPVENGGENKGPGPKKFLLTALAGCTAMDVVALAEKMRAGLTGFQVKVISKLADEHPKKYTNIQLVYICKGENLDKEKIEKAVKMSEEKYCGVWATLRPGVKIDYKIVFE